MYTTRGGAGAVADAKAPGDWPIITREDATKKWACKGRPLDRWAMDGKPGDRMGDRFDGANRHEAKE